MPNAAATMIYAVLSVALLSLSGGAEVLLAERLASLEQPTTGGFDVGRFLARVGSPFVPEPVSLGLVSWLGWALSFLILRLGRWGQIYTPLAVHPAAVLLAAGGYGLAMAALLAVFIGMERVMMSRSASSVPSLGIALGGAALAVPGFRALFVAFAAPLVLLAPRAMLERNMLAFYLVTLLPAVSIMAVLLVFDATPLFEERATTTPIRPPLAVIFPAAALIIGLFQDWRLTAGLVVISVGAFLTSTTGAAWPCSIAFLAAAFALHRKAHPMGCVIYAASVVLAASLLARHISAL